MRITDGRLLMLGFAGYGIGVWTPAFLVRSHGLSPEGRWCAVMGPAWAGWPRCWAR
jgi:hypothetical protein